VSYARWSADSDVYVFENVGGWIECCGCCLVVVRHFQADTAEAMAEHLGQHRAAGHKVPDGLEDRILTDPELFT
jgi:hypothetical protein